MRLYELKAYQKGGTGFYLNPSQKDLLGLIDNKKLYDIRGSALDSGDVWIWDARKKIHNDALLLLGVSHYAPRTDFLIENLTEYSKDNEYLFSGAFWRIEENDRSSEQSISLQEAFSKHPLLKRMLGGLNIDEDINVRDREQVPN